MVSESLKGLSSGADSDDEDSDNNEVRLRSTIEATQLKQNQFRDFKKTHGFDEIEAHLNKKKKKKLSDYRSTGRLGFGSDLFGFWVRKIPSLPPTGLGPGTLAAWIVWSLWSSRNQLIFKKRKFTPEEIILKAILDAKKWMMAQTPSTALLPKPLIRCEPDPNRMRICSIFADAA
ncbi:hypothetical protein BRARA_K00820 [Brassica rapa]|uniref:Uncharacterized protein n=1 Tax=Brassica campestris TaxID=3711 RepID=A0A397KWR2_BRACM|nr:hypothetical protein BRARA_K00820 [Brassica rapa]